MAASETQARRWLRLDAAYCAGAGVLALGLSIPLGRFLHVAPPLVGGIGIATVVWAFVLARLARQPSWRQPLRLVATANAAASLGVAALAVVEPASAPRLLLAAVALEVAGFAFVQARALRSA